MEPYAEEEPGEGDGGNAYSQRVTAALRESRAAARCVPPLQLRQAWR